MSIITELQNLQATQNRLLQQLPTELGYDSAQSLANAILQASTIVVDNRISSGRRGRRVPDEVRDAIRAELKEGTTPGYNLAVKYNVSYNIVHAIKQDLGLVKSHKKKRSRRA